MILLIDNFDSFTYNIVQAFQALNKEIVVFRNNEITYQQCLQMPLDLIVIGPGPNSIENTGISVELIHNFKNKVPILGICLGHQTIGYAFGAKITRAPIVMHGKTSKIIHNQAGIFEGIPNDIEMMRYHSLVLEKKTLPSCLEISALSDKDHQIMAINHKDYPIFGVQFHPESILSYGSEKLFKNILKMSAS